MNSDTEHDQDGDDDDDSLLDHGAEHGDQHDIVVQSLGTNGVSSETLMTHSPKQNQPRGCAFLRLTLKALYKYLIMLLAVKFSCMNADTLFYGSG